jgi:ribosomal-protein-alanine N-acetyltransferase
MNYSKIIYKRGTASKKDIVEHLYRCASNFEPPLDSYTNIEEYGSKIFEHAKTFEAWENNILIGLVAVYYNDMETRIGFITNVSVVKEKQGLGIAHILIENAIDYGKEKNFVQVDLEIKDINNTKVFNLYKNLGFTLTPQINNKNIMSHLLISKIEDPKKTL